MKLYIVLLFVVLLITGCKKDNPVTPPPNQEHGSLLFRIDPTNRPANVNSVTATITRSGFQTRLVVMNLLTDTTATASFTDVETGVWHLKVDARDSAEVIIYSGETDVNVLAGIQVQVNLVLTPTGLGTGGIIINVSWGTNTNPNYWSIQTSGVSMNLQSVFFISPTVGWTVGEFGKILKTTNGGAIWSSQSINTQERLNWVYFQNANTGWVVGENGAFFKTSNGGTNWSQVDIIIPFSLYQILFYEQYGWVVGNYGTIYRTTNSGDSWTQQISNTDRNLYGVYFLTSSLGYACGQSGIILKTVNGGNSWFISEFYSGLGWLQSIKFVSTNIGVTLAGLGLITKTTNGGTTWFSVNSGTSEHLEDIVFINSTTGFAVGDHGKVLKTTNAGTAWVSEPKITNSWLNGAYFVNENTGWTVGNNGTILKYNR